MVGSEGRGSGGELREEEWWGVKGGRVEGGVGIEWWEMFSLGYLALSQDISNEDGNMDSGIIVSVVFWMHLALEYPCHLPCPISLRIVPIYS